MASITGLNTNGINFSGLATGINTDTLIEGLTRINQQRIDRLKSRQQDIASRQTAINELKQYLYELQDKISGMYRSLASDFDTNVASASDPTVLTVSAGSSAPAGTYTFSVEGIAKAHMVASTGFADPNTRIKQGTITIQVGNGPATTINIDESNNTLQGIAQAINANIKDVRATVINDGSANSYKLVIASNRTGTTNTISITNNLTSGAGADIDLAAQTLQQASDAVLLFGDSSSGSPITARFATNQIDTLIPGVTLNLLKADPGKQVGVTVSHDTEKIKNSIKEFVTSFNKVMDYINQQSKYNPEDQQAGVLLGNRDVNELVDDLVSSLLVITPDTVSGIDRLSKIGITLDDSNKLVLDESKLNSVLSRADASTIQDIKKLFAITGQSDNTSIKFVQGTIKTRPTTTGYGVEVLSPATQATLIGSTPLDNEIDIQSGDDTLYIRINNSDVLNLNIGHGLYNPQQLVATLQTLINNNIQGGIDNYVNISLDSSNRLQIASARYGSSSRVQIIGGTALSQLGLIAGQSAQGTDVVGQYLVDGQVEAAIGTGQILSGLESNTNTAGLQVLTTTASPTLGNVTVTHGVAARLTSTIDKYLNPTSGRLNNLVESYQTQIDDINKEVDKQNAALEQRKNDLVKQFAAMESAVNNLRTLQAQLISIMPAQWLATSK